MVFKFHGHNFVQKTVLYKHLYKNLQKYFFIKITRVYRGLRCLMNFVEYFFNLFCLTRIIKTSYIGGEEGRGGLNVILTQQTLTGRIGPQPDPTDAKTIH